MGLESSQMGGAEGVPCIRLLGIPATLEGRNEIGFKEGIGVCFPPESSVSPFRILPFLLGYHFLSFADFHKEFA